MQRLRNTFLGVLLATASALGSALELGDTLPPVKIPTKGELILQNDSIHYTPWSSEQIHAGTPALVFHLAARLSSESIIDPLRTRLKEVDYPEGSFQSVSVINLGDAMWGAAGLAASAMSKNKKETPSATLVADDDNRALAAWGLQSKTVAVILLNAEGRIVYFHEGSLSEADIETIITMLNAEITKANAAA
ncbi:MAG: YtfJ family protein [Spongiibacter sp.]|uniref:YtfJ family protein n=1 Tax=Spongiibacter thalassae TaxID=2721624 RepID=A0ABX1GDW7_9GAMM|nr:YtfJ family protein [Spongiibacter thalassae]NKI17126.1 hypothetical protein [Spongiibacter thalassae]